LLAVFLKGIREGLRRFAQAVQAKSAEDLGVGFGQLADVHGGMASLRGGHGPAKQSL
jgi:hypothetical protein